MTINPCERLLLTVVAKGKLDNFGMGSYDSGITFELMTFQLSKPCFLFQFITVVC